MTKPWFDPESGIVLFDGYVLEMDSFKQITGDQVITDAELADQAHKVASLLRTLEGMLSPEAHSVATEVFCELAVLNALQKKRIEARWAPGLALEHQQRIR